MGPRLLRGDYKWVGNGESNAFRGVAERRKKEALLGPEAERTAEPAGARRRAVSESLHAASPSQKSQPWEAPRWGRQAFAIVGTVVLRSAGASHCRKLVRPSSC